MDKYTIVINVLLYVFCVGIIVEAFDIRLLSKCEPVRTDFCTSLYNETHLDRSQEDAILDLKQYKELDSIDCAKNLRLFLCGTFLPMCTVLDKPIRPCRSLCEEVKSGCEKVLMRYTRLPWPKQLRCEQYPEKDSNPLCIGKDKKEEKVIRSHEVLQNKRTKINEEESVELNCKGLDKINFKRIIHENSNCNRALSQQTLGKLCNGEQHCKFQLKYITKASNQPASCTPGNIGSSSIKYHCTTHNQARKMTLRYGQDETLYCKSATRHLSILNVQFKDENCISPNAYCSVSQSCTGMKKCALWFDKNYLQSPCQGKNIKMIVHYECLKSKKNEEIELVKYIKDGVTLQCPSDKTITIVRAEYISEFCRNKKIYCAVNLRCEKKRYCNLTKLNLSAVKCYESRSRILIRYMCT